MRIIMVMRRRCVPAAGGGGGGGAELYRDSRTTRRALRVGLTSQRDQFNFFFYYFGATKDFNEGEIC